MEPLDDRRGADEVPMDLDPPEVDVLVMKTPYDVHGQKAGNGEQDQRQKCSRDYSLHRALPCRASALTPPM